MSIRLATNQDVPRIKELCTRFYENSPYKEIPMEVEKQGELITHLMSSDDGLILCLWKNDQIIGILAATVTEILFSYAKIAAEIVWWIEPEHRGSKDSISLVSAFEHWAEEVVRADIIQMVALEDENVETVSRFYKRKGYTPVERGFIKHFGRN